MARAARSKAPSTMSHFSKAATFSVTQPSHSPGRRSDKGFSGPIVSIIPIEARHKKRNSSGRGGEPSSPKISCMGQIKKKKKKKKKSSATERKKERETEKPGRRIFCFCFKGLFRRKVRPGGEPYGKEVEEKTEKRRLPEVGSSAAPRLGQMRRYQSGRETLSGFDWRKATEKSCGEGEKEEEEIDVCIPHSAPILVGDGAVALEPKKELNLWRRRDMNAPLPLQIEKN